MGRRNRNFGRTLFYFPVFVFLASLLYNLYDNRRIIVIEQEIFLERLPVSFDGFRILQVSDLHGKFFGKNQASLIKLVNSLDFDMIAFTGDMNASTDLEESPGNSKAILDFLDGIEDSETMFWVDGNAGPHAIHNYAGAKTGELTPIGMVLRDKGCKILVLPYAITRENDQIWITPEMLESDFDMGYRFQDERAYGGKENHAKIKTFYYEEAYLSYLQLKGNGDLKIMLSHIPKQTDLTPEELKQYGAALDYDLILAGHYHGGQFRLPFIGAFYIPSPATGINNSGYFPAQTAVKGLSYHGEIPQYVSAGLGASGHLRLAGFRLFNTPEINLITLRRGT